MELYGIRIYSMAQCHCKISHDLTFPQLCRENICFFTSILSKFANTPLSYFCMHFFAFCPF